MSPTLSSRSRRVSVARGRVGTRKWVVAVAASAMLCSISTSAVTAAPSPDGAARTGADGFGGHDYVTRPDLHPSEVEVITPANGTQPGYVLHSPAPAVTFNLNAPHAQAPVQTGALITDDAGEPVWAAPSPKGAVTTNLQQQTYQGQPVLSWWQGKPINPPGYGEGEFVIADSSYRPIATVRAGNGLKADLHEFVITPQNTAILCSYVPVKRDLRPIGGPENATVLDSVIQEVDIASGKVLFEWKSLDHVGEGESMLPVPSDPNAAWDYFHVNSLDLDGEGNLLISGRNTHAVYQVNRQTGAVNWRLNGKNSDFRMGPGAGFAWQHDARRQADGALSVFDNSDNPQVGPYSRAITLKLDEQARTASVTKELVSPEKLLTPNQGNNRVQPNGNSFVGWGGKPFFSEFAPDGRVLFHAQFAKGVASYRSLKIPWVGKPLDAPAVVGRTGPNGQGTSVFASWNGATEVRAWRVLVGPDPEHLRAVKDAPRTGFETAVDVPEKERFVAMHALDVDGAVIGTSPAVEVTG